jgi:hypothetical protein
MGTPKLFLGSVANDTTGGVEQNDANQERVHPFRGQSLRSSVRLKGSGGASDRAECTENRPKIDIGKSSVND